MIDQIHPAQEKTIDLLHVLKEEMIVRHQVKEAKNPLNLRKNLVTKKNLSKKSSFLKLKKF